MSAPFHVVLLRAPREDDPYERAFRRAGFAVRSRPVLRFAFVGGGALREALGRPERYGGLVCTSPRAVEAVERAVEQPREAARRWAGRPAWAVGPRTAERLRALGFEARGERAGDAERLAALITAQPPRHPLLFLSGNRRRDVLPRVLRQAGVPFEERCVYRTARRSALDLGEGPVDWLVFFSPSGVEAARRAGVLDTAARRAAIGPTTAASLARVGRPAHAVAARPGPEPLVEALITTQNPKSQEEPPERPSDTRYRG